MFNYAPMEEKTFHSWDSLLDHTHDEEKYVKPLNMGEHNDWRFENDEYLCTGTDTFKLNEKGMSGFNSRILPTNCKNIINKLTDKGLASDVLNNLLQTNEAKEQIKKTNLIIDHSNGTILGAVGLHYGFYPNFNFTGDLMEIFGDNVKFERATITNTKMNLSVVDVREEGEISGSGGVGVDKFALGLNIGNSMVGDLSLLFDYFLRRDVCANGMQINAFNHNNRIIHKGDDISSKIENVISNTTEGLGKLRESLDKLAGIPFNPTKLVDLGCSVNFIDGKEYPLYPSNFYNPNKEYLTDGHREKSFSDTVEYVKNIPYLFGGETSRAVFSTSFRDNASMWDFVNVYTEEVKKHTPAIRNEIERNSGILMNQIVSNREEFFNGETIEVEAETVN